MSPISVYNRFENKDGLIVALAMRTLDQLAEAIDIPNHVESVERFREACRSYRDFALRHPARYSLDLRRRQPARRPILRGRRVPVAQCSPSWFELTGALRSTASEEDSAEAAQIVWSAIHGAVTIEQRRNRSDTRCRRHLRTPARPAHPRRHIGSMTAGAPACRSTAPNDLLPNTWRSCNIRGVRYPFPAFSARGRALTVGTPRP